MNSVSPPTATAWVNHAVWMVIGPGLAALAGTYILTSGLGPTGSKIHYDLNSSAAFSIIGVVACLVAIAAGAGLTAVIPRRFAAIAAVGGIAAMTIGSLAIGLTPTTTIYVAGQVVAGIGAGAAWTASIVIALSHQRWKRLMTALLAGLGVLSLLLAPVASGAVSQFIGWRAANFAVIPVLLVAMVPTAVAAAVQLYTTSNSSRGLGPAKYGFC